LRTWIGRLGRVFIHGQPLSLRYLNSRTVVGSLALSSVPTNTRLRRLHIVHALHCSLNLKESYMSLINGDKARDHKRHKKLIKKRQKLQELKAKRAAGPQKSKPLMGR